MSAQFEYVLKEKMNDGHSLYVVIYVSRLFDVFSLNRDECSFCLCHYDQEVVPKVDVVSAVLRKHTLPLSFSAVAGGGSRGHTFGPLLKCLPRSS